MLEIFYVARFVKLPFTSVGFFGQFLLVGFSCARTKSESKDKSFRSFLTKHATYELGPQY